MEHILSLEGFSFIKDYFWPVYNESTVSKANDKGQNSEGVFFITLIISHKFHIKLLSFMEKKAVCGHFSLEKFLAQNHSKLKLSESN